MEFTPKKCSAVCQLVMVLKWNKLMEDTMQETATASTPCLWDFHAHLVGH